MSAEIFHAILAQAATSAATQQVEGIRVNEPNSHNITAILVISGVTILVVGYSAVRYWLVVSEREAKKVATPTIDRLNARALEQMVDESAEEAEAQIEAVQHEAAPDDLLEVVPDELPMDQKKGPPKT